MALSARTKTLAVSILVHLALGSLLALGGRHILAPPQREHVTEMEILVDEVVSPEPETPSVAEPEPEIPVVNRPERVPEKVVEKVTETPLPFQENAPLDEGEHDAPEDAEAIAAPTSPLVFAMTSTVGGASGLEYTSTTGGGIALPPPGPGGGAPGQSYTPGATKLKVARDWQVTRRAMPTNDSSFDPTYPPLAKRQGREARVVVELAIDKTGVVAKAKVLEGPQGHGFRESALAYSYKLRFEPAYSGDNPVASRIEWTVHFYVRN